MKFEIERIKGEIATVQWRGDLVGLYSTMEEAIIHAQKIIDSSSWKADTVKCEWLSSEQVCKKLENTIASLKACNRHTMEPLIKRLESYLATAVKPKKLCYNKSL